MRRLGRAAIMALCAAAELWTIEVVLYPPRMALLVEPTPSYAPGAPAGAHPPSSPRQPSRSFGLAPESTPGHRPPASPRALSMTRTLTGRASWYPADGKIAAAGPRLRAALGKGWRGSLVRVSEGRRSVVVRLVDWCQCYRGTKRERLVDLSDDAFGELAPLGVGVLRVTVAPLVPPATDVLTLGY